MTDNLNYSKGISWFNDARVPFVDDVSFNKKLPAQQGGTIYGGGKGFYRTEEITEYKEGGRFPANLLVCDDVLNDGNYYKTGIAKIPKGKKIYGGNSLLNSNTKDFGGDFGAIGEKGGTNSRYYDLDKWFDKIINE